MSATCPAELHMMRDELLADPFHGYGRIREQGPVVAGEFIDGTPAWFVTRLEDVRTVLRDPRFVNGDPRIHQQLDLLQLPRQMHKYLLGFGHGIHYCLGATLARQEAEIALGHRLPVRLR